MCKMPVYLRTDGIRMSQYGGKAKQDFKEAGKKWWELWKNGKIQEKWQNIDKKV